MTKTSGNVTKTLKAIPHQGCQNVSNSGLSALKVTLLSKL